MKHFRLFEKYKNLFTVTEKSNYSTILFEMLQRAYKNIGGIKGNGFSSPQDIEKNIPLIKIALNNNEIKCAVFYKFKDGRKTVAICTDGTREGYFELKRIMEQEFKRSYFEISHMMLNFIKNNFPTLLDKYKIPNNTKLDIFKNIIPIDEFYYKRKIGDEYVTKIALGTPFKELY